MNVYCNLHRKVEHFTNNQAEALITGLICALAEESANADGMAHDEDPYELIYGSCPSKMLHDYSDGEMYYEHIEQARETRLYLEREARKQ